MGAVLIVDDHLPTARLVARLLRSAGHLADCAAGGREALASLESSRPDVVVLDVMMPGVDGMAVLRRLRSDRRFASLPVLMYSAVDDERQQSAALSAGANGYIVKGRADWQELQARIEPYLSAPGPGPQGR